MLLFLLRSHENQCQIDTRQGYLSNSCELNGIGPVILELWPSLSFSFTIHSTYVEYGPFLSDHTSTSRNLFRAREIRVRYFVYVQVLYFEKEVNGKKYSKYNYCKIAPQRITTTKTVKQTATTVDRT